LRVKGSAKGCAWNVAASRFSICAFPPVTASIDRFGTSYGVVVAIAPFAMPLMDVERFDSDVRIAF